MEEARFFKRGEEVGTKPWVMTQQWQDTVFLHWPVSPQWIRKFIPEELELDVWKGTAWIGIVLFKAVGMRPRFLPPIPSIKNYLELNVRTYVKFNGKSGVYFLSLDADSWLAVEATTKTKFLPYRHARMEMSKWNGQYIFKSHRTHKNSFPESLKLHYKIISGTIRKNAFEYWATERYCLWTKPKDRLVRVDIVHSPWVLKYIEGEIHWNSMASFLPDSLHQSRPISHFGGTQKVRFLPPAVENKKTEEFPK